MNIGIITGNGKARLSAVLIWILIVPVLPGLLIGGPALAQEPSGTEAEDELWNPFNLWCETPLETCWPLRINPAGGTSGAEAEETGEVERFPSTYPPQGLCTNYSGIGFNRGGVMADSSPWFQPTSDNFPYMITDNHAPSVADIVRYIEAIEARVFQNRKYKVRILNDIAQVRRDGVDPRLQIVVNHVVNYGPGQDGYGCFTLYFPPFFKALGFSEVEPLDSGRTFPGSHSVQALTAGERYPILFQTNGWGASNNLSFKTGDGGSDSSFFDNPSGGCYFPYAVIDGYEHDEHGFVYVQSNGGGLGSVGYNREYLKDVAWMINRLHTGFHCDRERVVTVGSSRGGGVALQVAINPYAGEADFPALPYDVLGIFSRVSPLGAGTLSQTPLTINPTLNSLYSAELGDGAGRYDHTPPPLIDPALVLEAPMATTDIDQANDLSPDGLLVDNLRGKFIFLMHGTQDSWMSERHWLSLERKLSMRMIDHTSVTVLNTGHNLPPPVGPWQSVFADFVLSVIDDPEFDPSLYVPQGAAHGTFENARDYYWKGDLDQVTYWENVFLLENQATLPFSASIPYRMGRVVNDNPPGNNHEPGCIELHGTAGRAWRVEIEDQDGPLPAPWGVMEGTFGHVGLISEFAETVHLCWGHEGLPRMDTAQYYQYRIFYEDQWGAMQDVSNFTNFETNPGHRILPITWITETQPYPGDPVNGYFMAHTAGGQAYMMSLGINWCETCPQE